MWGISRSRLKHSDFFSYLCTYGTEEAKGEEEEDEEDEEEEEGEEEEEEEEEVDK